MTTIEIPIRELHARTGHYIRLASRDTDVIITEHGMPAARITQLPPPESTYAPIGKRRSILPAYGKALSSGNLASSTDSTAELREISALRDL